MSQDEVLPVLKVSLHDVRYFATLLRGVHFVNVATWLKAMIERATVNVTKRGLTITAEEARTLLGTAFIFSEIFDEYTFNPPPDDKDDEQGSQGDDAREEEDNNPAFEIPIGTVLECLNIFGTAGPASTPGGTVGFKKWKKEGDGDGDGGDRDQFFFGGGVEKRTGMRMTFHGAGYPLILILAEDASGPTTTCEITTFDPEPLLELDFDGTQQVLKIILKSSWLRDALSELDPSCEKLTFIGNPPEPRPPRGRALNFRPTRAAQQPMFRIQAAGSFGSTEMDYPNDREVLETFECSESVSFSYRFSHISRTMRALQNSTKSSLRIDANGLLSIQFMMPVGRTRGSNEGSTAFIEFRCLALDEDL